jgi:DNA topoisomerase I
VQSVALRLICERESEIETFKSQEYWTIEGDFAAGGAAKIPARLTHVDGQKLGKFSIPDEKTARDIARRLAGRSWKVATVERKQTSRNPHPPFTTSTLQQEASRKLSMAATQTMRIAQQLYEGIDIGGQRIGLITYMRTDGISLSNEAIQAARNLIASDYGASYLPDSPRTYKNPAKNAQEAHEAIRPTDLTRRPEDVAKSLNAEQLNLYRLIWQRTLASQMANAVLDQVAVDIASQDPNAIFRATGSVVAFDGFLKLYTEDLDEEADSEENRRLPDVSEGQALALSQIIPERHSTQPPPRYSEASLVKTMEQLGIGRPSTYASIMQVLQDRSYVTLEKRRFVPSDRGRLVTSFLANFFLRYVEHDFTADLEQQLDDVSGGRLSWKKVLSDFWQGFSAAIAATKHLELSRVAHALDQTLATHFFPQHSSGADPRQCPVCHNGRLALRLGNFAAFIGCANYPECTYTRPLDIDHPGQSNTKSRNPKSTR